MPPTTMTEDGGKRVILKNSEGNKKAEAGKHIFSASKRDSLSALQYQNVKQRRSPWDSSKSQRRHARSLKKSTAPLLNAIGLNLEKPPPRKPRKSSSPATGQLLDLPPSLNPLLPTSQPRLPRSSWFM